MTHEALRLPIRFEPVYQNVVWGGRRLAQWREDLPDGPVGESWEISDEERGMSLVAEGGLAGVPLDQLVSEHAQDLLGEVDASKGFPLLIKVIDAQDRLSVQVHPDDDLAVSLGVGDTGKTECWLMLDDGGELFQGTQSGVDRASFEAALAENRVEETLNRFHTHDGDFFFLPARTVHALGTGCLLVEVQQASDITFRVSDWGRVGMDGKPRPLHVDESLATIDFSASGHGPVVAPPEDHPRGGSVRHLVNCPFFTVEERRALHTAGGREGSCAIVINAGAPGRLATAAGSVEMAPLQTWLVPAAAGPWTASATADEPMRLVVAYPNQA